MHNKALPYARTVRWLLIMGLVGVLQIFPLIVVDETRLLRVTDAIGIPFTILFLLGGLMLLLGYGLAYGLLAERRLGYPVSLSLLGRFTRKAPRWAPVYVILLFTWCFTVASIPLVGESYPYGWYVALPITLAGLHTLVLVLMAIQHGFAFLRQHRALLDFYPAGEPEHPSARYVARTLRLAGVSAAIIGMSLLGLMIYFATRLAAGI